MDPDGIMDPEAALTLALGGGFGAISLPVRPLQDDDDHPQACDVFDITEPFDPSTGWPAYVPPNVVKAWGSEPRTAWFPSNDHLYYYVPPGVFQHKSLPYPNGQSGRHVSKIGMIDYSDPRFFRPEKHERIFIIRMLGATMSDFRRLTGTRMMAVDVPDIDLGYAAAHNQVVLKFEAWVRDHRDISGDFREHGQVKKDVLYKLDRWYGLIEHWQFSPNCKVWSLQELLHPTLIDSSIRWRTRYSKSTKTRLSTLVLSVSWPTSAAMDTRRTQDTHAQTVSGLAAGAASVSIEADHRRRGIGQRWRNGRKTCYAGMRRVNSEGRNEGNGWRVPAQQKLK